MFLFLNACEFLSFFSLDGVVDGIYYNIAYFASIKNMKKREIPSYEAEVKTLKHASLTSLGLVVLGFSFFFFNIFFSINE